MVFWIIGRLTTAGVFFSTFLVLAPTVSRTVSSSYEIEQLEKESLEKDVVIQNLQETIDILEETNRAVFMYDCFIVLLLLIIVVLLLVIIWVEGKKAKISKTP